ncbi:MAG TPA: polysaccharide biosynthesis C-terminal domain-containing protein [Blastocatellia bacterium]|nr:polysaccharide biosynthesis C-terminal domain-containing protein [Blastocatellia bacterium]
MLRPLILRTLATGVIIVAVGFINSMLLSRWLGPTGRGEIAAAMLWPSMLVYLSSFGLFSATAYFAALPESRPQTIFANNLVFTCLQGALAMAVGYVALPWLLHSQSETVVRAARWFLTSIPLALVAQYGVSLLQGQMRLTAFNLLRAILPAGYLIGTVVLKTCDQLTLSKIILLHIGLHTVVLFSTLATLWRLGIRPRLRLDGALASRMGKYGAKVQAGMVTGIANQNLDQMVMAAWLPAADLGLYVAAVSAAMLPQVFTQAVQTVATPGIVRAESAAARVTVLQGVFRRYWLLSGVIVCLLAAALPVAIPLVFGPAFRGAIGPAEVLLLGTFLIGAKEVLASGANALGDPWLSSKAQIWAVGVTIVLLYLLLPPLGIWGAAIASVAAYATQLLIMLHGLRRAHEISPAALFRVRLADLRASFIPRLS